jgi:phage terminase large subunit GpA-like protein
VKQSIHKSLVVASKGRGIKAGNLPMLEYQRRPGEQVGLNWLLTPLNNQRASSLFHIDTNFWKTFVQSRLAVSKGDKGSITLHKASYFDHRLVADHICNSESPIKTDGRGRTVVEWSQKPERPDNEFFDCLVGCAAAASREGIGLEAHATVGTTVEKIRIKLSDYQQRGRR